ncbi:MAG: hypothetical protein LBM62_08005 [Mediterranea sp.]|nr:hypothetical protein [Mediterranea sp.]
MKNKLSLCLTLAAISTLTAAMLLASCSDGDQPVGRSAEECEVSMQLSTGHTQTRAADDEEVKSIDILVFNGKDLDVDNATFEYSRVAWKKDDGSYQSTLLQASELDLYFAVNVHDLVQSLTEGMKWSEAKEKLQLTDPDKLGTEIASKGLPMWGMLLNKSIGTGASYQNLGKINLIRAVASTDLAITASDFTLTGWYIADGTGKGYLAYNPAYMDATNKFFTPEIPAGITYQDWTAVAPTDPTAAWRFYMYENGSSTTNTKVILQGSWSGSTINGDTYYPLAFRDPTDHTKKRDVTRNSKFIITVTNVNGDGFESLEDAKKGEETNLDYEVIAWDEDTQGDIFVDGSHWFSIDTRRNDVSMPRSKDAVASLRFVTAASDLTAIKMKLSDTDLGENLLLDTHPRFKLERTTRTDASGTEFNCFLITTKKDYQAGEADLSATFIITVANRIKFEIHVTQVDGADDDWDGGYSNDTEIG